MTEESSSQMSELDETVLAAKRMRVSVDRSLEGLKCTQQFDDNLPTFHPTLVTIKADFALKVLQDGQPVARIMLHKNHIRNNIPYFECMFRDQSNFRENSTSELSYPFAVEILNEYFKSIYGAEIDITRKNCCALSWTADYFTDAAMVERCTLYFETHMDQLLVFEILGQTDKYNDICEAYIKRHGVKSINLSPGPISSFTLAQAQWFFETISPLLNQFANTEFISLWLPGKTDANHLDLLTNLGLDTYPLPNKFKIYNACRNKLLETPNLEQQLFITLFSNKSAPIEEPDRINFKEPWTNLTDKSVQIIRKDGKVMTIQQQVSNEVTSEKDFALHWQNNPNLEQASSSQTFFLDIIEQTVIICTYLTDDQLYPSALRIEGPTASPSDNSQNSASSRIVVDKHENGTLWTIVSVKGNYFQLSAAFEEPARRVENSETRAEIDARVEAFLSDDNESESVNSSSGSESTAQQDANTVVNDQRTLGGRRKVCYCDNTKAEDHDLFMFRILQDPDTGSEYEPSDSEYSSYESENDAVNSNSDDDDQDPDLILLD